jgi:hypothetical protein
MLVMTMMTTVTIMTAVRLHIVPVVGPVLVLGAGLKYQAPNDEHHNCENY